MTSRLVNSRRNIIGLGINRILNILLPFFTRTVFIYCLGSIYLGLNSLFSSILSVLSLAELGMGSAMVFSMYKPIAENDDEKVCALLYLYKRVYRIIGVIVLVLGLLIIPIINILIEGDYPQNINIYIIYVTYLLNSVIGYFMFSYKESVVIASQRNDIISAINTITLIFLTIAQIAVLVLLKNYYLYCFMLPVSTFLGSLLRNNAANRRYPQYFCKGKLDSQDIADIKKRVAGLFIYKLCDVLRNSFDSIIISAFLGLSILAKFNNYFYIISAVSGLIGVFSNSITSSVGNSIAKESKKKNYNDFEKIQLLYMWIAGFCTVSLYCLYQPFIQVWIGSEWLLSRSSVILFCIYFWVARWGDICYIYRQAAGLWWQDKVRPIVEAIVNLSLNFFLVKFIGVAGVLLSTIIELVFINSIWGSKILFRYYFTEEKQSRYILKLLYFTCVTGISCLLTDYVRRILVEFLLINNEWLSILCTIFLCIIIPNIIFYFSYRRLKEFGASIKLVRAAFNKI